MNSEIEIKVFCDLKTILNTYKQSIKTIKLDKLLSTYS